MNALHAIGVALRMAFLMFWQILWPLILGFTLSVLVLRFLRADGPTMLKMMDMRPNEMKAMAGTAQGVPHGHGN